MNPQGSPIRHSRRRKMQKAGTPVGMSRLKDGCAALSPSWGQHRKPFFLGIVCSSILTSVAVASQGEQVRLGDLRGHTSYFDGLSKPQDAYYTAGDSGIDFFPSLSTIMKRGTVSGPLTGKAFGFH